MEFWFTSVQFSRSVVSDSLQPHESQHARPPCPSPTPESSLRLTSIKSVMPCSHLIRGCPLLLLPPIPPSIRVFSNESTLCMRWQRSSLASLAAKAALTSLLLKNTQGWSPLEWTGWISLQSKGLWRVFSTPQFKSINFLALSFLHSPTLTSIHDQWKNHSLD